MKTIQKKGFTLIETMVALSLLSVAIVAPMSLTTQSLSAAYFARDQITAFNLAQEGLESIRALRDGQILCLSRNTCSDGTDLFGPIPQDQDFVIDSRESDPVRAIHNCNASGCPKLQTNGQLYGYRPSCAFPTSDCLSGEGWANTNFTRTLHASYVAGTQDEIRVEATVTWKNGPNARAVSIYENFYRWVEDGSASS